MWDLLSDTLLFIARVSLAIVVIVIVIGVICNVLIGRAFGDPDG